MKKYNTIQNFLRNIGKLKDLSGKPKHLFTIEGILYAIPQKFQMDGIIVKTEVKEGRMKKGSDFDTYKITFTIETPESHKQDFEGSPLLFEKLEIKAIQWLYKTYFANIISNEKDTAKDLKTLQTKAITLKHKFRDYAELALGI